MALRRRNAAKEKEEDILNLLDDSIVQLSNTTEKLVRVRAKALEMKNEAGRHHQVIKQEQEGRDAAEQSRG